MNIKDYLDSTYLKTPEQSGLSKKETWEQVKKLTEEAIENDLYAVMIRPDLVKKTRKLLDDKKSKVVLGTVISFNEGTLDTESKIAEAKQAIKDGADELDFVINYKSYKSGNLHGVAEEVKLCNKFVLGQNKLIKWIIEAAALSDEQIIGITKLIKSVTQEYSSGQEDKVYVKSSTGFYKTSDGKPNGATEHNIKLMIDNAGNLPVKAAGGVRNYQEAKAMIELGVKRIGTSSALTIANGEESLGDY